MCDAWLLILKRCMKQKDTYADQRIESSICSVLLIYRAPHTHISSCRRSLILVNPSPHCPLYALLRRWYPMSSLVSVRIFLLPELSETNRTSALPRHPPPAQPHQSQPQYFHLQLHDILNITIDLHLQILLQAVKINFCLTR